MIQNGDRVFVVVNQVIYQEPNKSICTTFKVIIFLPYLSENNAQWIQKIPRIRMDAEDPQGGTISEDTTERDHITELGYHHHHHHHHHHQKTVAISYSALEV